MEIGNVSCRASAVVKEKKRSNIMTTTINSTYCPYPGDPSKVVEVAVLAQNML
jgi:hypothetical protein